jgi:CBS domain-containing protein
MTAEMLIYRFYRERGVGRDSDVLEAWETVRRRFSPVMVVEAGMTALASHLWEGLQEYLKKESLTAAEALEGIETELDIFRAYADPAQPRRYLHGLFGHVERYFQLPEELKEGPSLIAIPKIIATE